MQLDVQLVSFTAAPVFSKTDCLQSRYLGQRSTEAVGGNKSYSPDKADCTPSSQRPAVQRDELAKIPWSHRWLPLPFHTWADTMETQHHEPTLIYFKTFCRIKQNIVHFKIVLRQLRGCSILGIGCSMGQETTGWYKKWLRMEKQNHNIELVISLSFSHCPIFLTYILLCLLCFQRMGLCPSH